MQERMQVRVGDITRLSVEAIVNAANTSLLGGGGVDGAIHRAAGPELFQACRALGGCLPGQAKLTAGFGLPAPWVIHTVGPVWQGGTAGEDEVLASCYRSSLALAEAHGLARVAFPAISTGAYGFPLRRATAIAVGAVAGHLDQSARVSQVLFVCFDERTAAEYRLALARAGRE